MFLNVQIKSHFSWLSINKKKNLKRHIKSLFILFLDSFVNSQEWTLSRSVPDIKLVLKFKIILVFKKLLTFKSKWPRNIKEIYGLDKLQNDF